MASVRELQQQLMQSHEYIRQMNQEIQVIKTDAQSMLGKINFLNDDRVAKDNVIQQLQSANAQLSAQVSAAGGGHGRPQASMGSLVNLKTMAPKKFGGGPSENYKSWAKSVRAFCNAHKPGFKKFLKWCERQAAEIGSKNLQLAWEHRETASELLRDFCPRTRRTTP